MAKKNETPATPEPNAILALLANPEIMATLQAIQSGQIQAPTVATPAPAKPASTAKQDRLTKAQERAAKGELPSNTKFQRTEQGYMSATVGRWFVSLSPAQWATFIAEAKTHVANFNNLPLYVRKS